MVMMKSSLVLLAALNLSACAAIIDGASQDVAVNSNPPGANCILKRKDDIVTVVTSTPSTIHIDKTKNDLTITCKKEGYDDAVLSDKSGIDNWVFGNILIGGLIGWGIDSATGSDNNYDTPVTLNLVKKDNAPTVPAAPLTN